MQEKFTVVHRLIEGPRIGDFVSGVNIELIDLDFDVRTGSRRGREYWHMIEHEHQDNE